LLEGHICDDACQPSYPNNVQTHPHDEEPGENLWASEQMRVSLLLDLERSPAPPHMEFA